MNKSYISLEKLNIFLEHCKGIFAKITHTHTKFDITDLPTKLSELENDLDITSVDSELNSHSTNPVQNKVITEEINNLKITIGEIENLLESV